MSQCTVTLTSNAGVSISLGGLHIWVDAIHDQQVTGFSTLSPAQWDQLRRADALSPPDFICFTHCHADHYSPRLTAEAARYWPSAQLVLPEQAFPGQRLLRKREEVFSAGGDSFRFFRLPHEGNLYTQVPHYGLILSHDGFRVLITGDCQVASPELKEFFQGSPADLALLDFPWITLRKGREFVQNVICPKHLLVYHLPFAEDDHSGYRAAAEHALQSLSFPDVRILSEPFQTEEV